MSQNKNDYMCIFAETGESLKLPAYIYAKSFDEIKASCEAKFGGVGKYIRKNDWINPENKYACFKIELDYYGIPKRDQYGNYEKSINPDSKNPIKYHTKSECSKFKKHSAYIVNDPKKPILKLDDFPTKSKEEQSRTNILIYFYITIVIVYLIWNLKFATIRPYYLYDYIEGSVLFRIFLLLIITGGIILIFCPFKSCWLPRYASKYRKEPLNELYRDFCKMYKKRNGVDHTGCLVNKTVCTEHGDSFPGCKKDPNYKYMDWVEEYNRLDYQLKEKEKDDSTKDIKDIIKEEKDKAANLEI